MGSIFSSPFNTIHTLNIEVGDRHTVLHSTLYTHWISRYGIDIPLCIRKYSSWKSSCEFDIQVYIQHQTHFENRNIGSTFSSAFKNINLEYRAVGSTFSSAFNTIHTLNIKVRDRHTALHSTPYTLWISSYGVNSNLYIRKHLPWPSSTRINIQLYTRNKHYLNSELWVRHSALP